MKCLACGMEFNDELVKCPRCGFPVIGLVDDSEESRAQVLKLASDYRKKHWSAAKVYLKVYKNRIDNNDIVIENADYILLGETGELQEGQILWNSEKFARLKGYCELEITIESEGSDTKTLHLTAQNPKAYDFWHAGLKKKEDGSYCVVVGDNVKYTESNTFDIY